MTSLTKIRLAISFIAACATAIGLYAILRTFQALLKPDPDPALIIWSEHAGYFWRSWTVAYAGGMIGFVVWLISGHKKTSLDQLTKIIARVTLIALVLIALQGVLVP
jgi:hypothetical protein